MFEEERRDIREEKAMASIPEGMLELAVLAENAQVPAEGSPLPPAQGAEGGSPGSSGGPRPQSRRTKWRPKLLPKKRCSPRSPLRNRSTSRG